MLKHCLSTVLYSEDVVLVNESIVASRSVDWPVAFTNPSSSFQAIMESIPLLDRWDNVTGLFLMNTSVKEFDQLKEDIIRSVTYYNRASNKPKADTLEKPVSISDKKLEEELTDYPEVTLFYLMKFLPLEV